MILNGASIVIAEGAQLVVDNSAPDAITHNSGFIVSEGEHNIIKWNIGTTIGTYTIPWGYNANYIPLTLFKTAGIGNGHFLFSTYHTGWQNSAELPIGVANMHGASGTDNSAFASDRFWQINAQNYTAKPTLSSLALTYIDVEHSTVGNTINENNLRANRYNSNLASWTDNILESTLNTADNTVIVNSVDEANLNDWWVVGMLGVNLYWVAPSGSTSNLSANWSLTSGGVGNAGIPSLVDAMIFDSNSTVDSEIDADLTVANFIIDADYTGTITQGGSKITVTNIAEFSGGTFTGGTADIVVDGTLTLSGIDFTSTSTTLEIKENLIVSSGSFIHNNGTVQFSGTTTQNIDGLVENTFNHISITNTTSNPGVSIESNQNLEGVLTLVDNSIVDADGSNNTAIFTLISNSDNPTNDAAIGILPAGAQVTGNVTVQRFMAKEGPDNNRIYRYISSPVQNAAVSDFQNEIPVTGTFTGASTCSGCLPNQSMFSYDETDIADTDGSGTADLNDGYVNFPIAANSETFIPGKGYTVYVRGNILSTTMWDLRGTVNTGNATSISLPITYTSSGDILNDGWNLVGNPMPSSIDWDANTGWTKTNLDATIYLADNGNSTLQYATWNGTTGTNGGSRFIAIGQGFWVKANGENPVLSTNENTKAAGTQTTFFREGALENLLRITMTTGITRDEAVVHFREDATTDFDISADAWKLNNQLFNLSTLSSNNEKLAINSWSELLCSTSIKLSVTEAAMGTYTLKFTNIDSFTDDTQLVLNDAFATNSITIVENLEYTFTVTSDPNSQGTDRFVLHFQREAPPIVIQTVAEELSVGFTENIQWYFNGRPIPGATLPSIQPDSSGTYSVVVNYNGCVLEGSAEFLVTAIDEVIEDSPIVYPNPATEKVYIQSQKGGMETIYLINALGQQVDKIQSSIVGEQQTEIFSMEERPIGVYLIKIIKGQNVYLKRIIKN
ncbi:hypothetical protein SanaruYs_06920 [Chryseotalea sanaruensis]|uniref:Secretion system C-terminal sorting domain-containing protein n=1 Tax=Chryseotalea sanaruensis TaxID=2482724 RepID=A0A401U6H1_9BACT|nr:hypothetical protein SanaruYs_06920 [Chryseotalea sanaruensis]